MKQKSLIISEKTHESLKKFCKMNSYKMNDWVEKLIDKEIKKQNNESK
jgi:hypothetical protein